MINISKKNIPTAPGVYFFKNIRRQIIYIGKAKNLKSRIFSYFRKSAKLPPGKQIMIKEAKKIDFITAKSEIAALILEANLIKKHQPKYNIELKDDKSFLYIMIDLEPALPLVKLIRKKDMEILRNWEIQKLGNSKLKDENHKPKQTEKLYNRRQNNKKLFFGPYTSAKAVKIVLKYLKQIFPYKTNIKPQKKPCLAYYFKKCAQPCLHIKLTGADYQKIKKEYKKIAQNIILFLQGKFQKIDKNLLNLINKHSLNKNFEQAAVYRDIFKAWQNMMKHKNIISDLTDEYSTSPDTDKLKYLKKILNLKNIPYRLEAYDVSNIQGKYAVGALVVFENGQPEKSGYRRFKIKTVRQISDVDMLAEIIARRFKKHNTEMPDFILLDGGRPQLNTIIKTLQKINPQILAKVDIAALAKKEEMLYLWPKQKNQISLKPDFNLLIQARNEAHRFAIAYYRLKHSQKTIQQRKQPG